MQLPRLVEKGILNAPIERKGEPFYDGPHVRQIGKAIAHGYRRGRIEALRELKGSTSPGPVVVAKASSPKATKGARSPRPPPPWFEPEEPKYNPSVTEAKAWQEPANELAPEHPRQGDEPPRVVAEPPISHKTPEAPAPVARKPVPGVPLSSRAAGRKPMDVPWEPEAIADMKAHYDRRRGSKAGADNSQSPRPDIAKGEPERSPPDRRQAQASLDDEDEGPPSRTGT
jgi:hypothetical protein